MFSKDKQHYRATPRTTFEAFGPYHNFAPEKKIRSSALAAAGGVIALGILYGLLLAWRG